MKSENQKITINLPKEGSLGVLALGARGIRAWRKVRQDSNNEAKKHNE